MSRFVTAWIGLLLATMLVTSTAHAGPKAAIFPFELIDTSLQGEMQGARADEARRLLLVTEELKRLAGRSGRYELVDVSALAVEVEKAAPLHKCNGCDVDLARKAGAEVALTGTVQKVSNLILNMNIYVRDAASGKLVRVMSADIRSNTDESWLRGIRWLVENRLLSE